MYVLEVFSVQPQLYNASSNFYKRSEEFAKPLREAGARCEADEARAQNRKNLEVPQVLEYVKRIEEAKATHAANASISVMMKKITQE